MLGTGPSLGLHLEQLRLLAEQHDCVVMGSNNIGSFLAPDYHGFTNRKGLANYGRTIDVERSRVLIGAYVPDPTIRRHHRGPYERIMYVDDHEASFDISDGIITTSCRTVSILLLGVALVMGAERIFVAGTDGYGALAEGDRNLYGYEEDRYVELQQQMGVEYFRELDRYQSRFLAEISDYMAARGLQPLEIVTPTAYDAHYRPEALPPS